MIDELELLRLNVEFYKQKLQAYEHLPDICGECKWLKMEMSISGVKEYKCRQYAKKSSVIGCFRKETSTACVLGERKEVKK